MRPAYIYLKYVVICVLLPWILSCSEEEPYTLLNNPVKSVKLLLPTNGLGDMSFSDDIMRGVLQAQKEKGFLFYYHVPSDNKDAEEKLKAWQEDNSADCSLIILGSNEYENLARNIVSEGEKNTYLLIEASSRNFNIPVFRFSGYGVSFLAGVAAYIQTVAETAAYLGGQQGHSYIEECYTGFRDGYLYAGGKAVVAVYLSDAPDGFSMAQRAWQLADSLYQKYSFIYPVAGGSNSGVYRWLRNNQDQAKYAAGVDVDQSIYSDHIIGSMIKKVGKSLEDYIHLWMEGEEIPQWNLFDLQSGYTYFQIAKPYEDNLKEALRLFEIIAKEKELEYNKGRYE